MPAKYPAEIHALFRDAFNAGDLESLAVLYEASAVLVVDGKLMAGQPAIRNALKFSRQSRSDDA